MKYKTEWDLGNIYKKDAKAGVVKDLAQIKKLYLAFAKKYRKDKKHLKNAPALARAIKEYENLAGNPAAERPYSYFAYRTVLNSEDNEAQRSSSPWYVGFWFF